MIKAWFSKTELYPWAGKTSIYDAVQEQLDESGCLRGHQLPDDDEFWSGSAVRWVSGGMDGAFGHHGGGGDQSAAVAETVQLLVQLTRKPGNKTRRAAYLQLMQLDVLSVIDPLSDALRSSPGVNASALYEEALWLVRHGVHRNVVKFGIALLGMFETEGHRELVMTLGRHDEFTLYAAVAIRNSFTDANEALMELAQSVSGWGKIQLVERIEPTSSAIKDWMLRDGCANSVMNEYLAYTCAMKGDLHLALEAEEIDDALYEGTATILSALISGGPAEDIYDYDHAAPVIGHFVRHAVKHCTSLRQLTFIIDVLDMLKRDEEYWLGCPEKGWTAELLRRCQQECEAILAREAWPDLVWADIRSGGEEVPYAAIRTAKALHIDVWPELFQQLQQAPRNESLYYELMSTDDPERMQQLIELAERELPLADLTVGPAGETELGQQFLLHSIVSLIVQQLDEYPGIGRKLIETSLHSPVVRSRTMAVNALEAWPLVAWGAAVITSLKCLSELETDDSLRNRVKALIDKHEL